MLMDNRKLSEIIRMKKKKMMMAEPELVDSDARPDMNPNDIYTAEQHARIEETLDSPMPKTSSDKAMMDESYDGVGLSPEEKKRMGRLKMYLDSLDL